MFHEAELPVGKRSPLIELSQLADNTLFPLRKVSLTILTLSTNQSLENFRDLYKRMMKIIGAFEPKCASHEK